MMLEALRRLEPRIAAGVAAQTAMRLEGYPSPTKPLVPDQEALESQILEQLRLELRLQPSDQSATAIAKLADALDRQVDILSEQGSEAIFSKLNQEGRLASDTYNIQFEPHLADNFGQRWDIEEALAVAAVRGPHVEQSFGTYQSADHRYPLVTIFARFFNHRYPARSFWLLVLGSRQPQTLSVSQVWRVYPQEIDLTNCEALLDVVRAFAERFGVSVDLDGKRGKFFLEAKSDEIRQASRTVRLNARHNEKITVTSFSSNESGDAFLLIPVNLTEYFKSVEKWRGWDRGILQELQLNLSDPQGEARKVASSANTQTKSG